MSVIYYEAAKKALREFDDLVRAQHQSQDGGGLLITKVEITFQNGYSNRDLHRGLSHTAHAWTRTHLDQILAAHREKLVEAVQTTRKTALAELAALLIEEPPQ